MSVEIKKTTIIRADGSEVSQELTNRAAAPYTNSNEGYTLGFVEIDGAEAKIDKESVEANCFYEI